MEVQELIERLERLQGRAKYAGREKRKYARLAYPPKRRPILSVGDCELEVVDISEGGMKLFNYKQHQLTPEIRGTIEFASGITFEVSGKIIWQYRNELGLFTTRIPRFIIEEETYFLMRCYQQQEGRSSKPVTMV